MLRRPETGLSRRPPPIRKDITGKVGGLPVGMRETMDRVGYRAEVAEIMSSSHHAATTPASSTYTGAGPFLRVTRTRTHSRANRRHRAQGSLAASGWVGGTSGEGSQRRLQSQDGVGIYLYPRSLTCPCDMPRSLRWSVMAVASNM
jgi:hypothetical protein